MELSHSRKSSDSSSKYGLTSLLVLNSFISWAHNVGSFRDRSSLRNAVYTNIEWTTSKDISLIRQDSFHKPSHHLGYLVLAHQVYFAILSSTSKVGNPYCGVAYLFRHSSMVISQMLCFHIL